jgi:hypothetical protein
MPEPQVTAGFFDLTGLAQNDLSLLNAMNPITRELRAIRILLGILVTKLDGQDVDTTEFTGLEALEG